MAYAAEQLNNLANDKDIARKAEYGKTFDLLENMRDMLNEPEEQVQDQADYPAFREVIKGKITQELEEHDKRTKEARLKNIDEKQAATKDRLNSQKLLEQKALDVYLRNDIKVKQSLNLEAVVSTDEDLDAKQAQLLNNEYNLKGYIDLYSEVYSVEEEEAKLRQEILRNQTILNWVNTTKVMSATDACALQQHHLSFLDEEACINFIEFSSIKAKEFSLLTKEQLSMLSFADFREDTINDMATAKDLTFSDNMNSIEQYVRKTAKEYHLKFIRIEANSKFILQVNMEFLEFVQLPENQVAALQDEDFRARCLSGAMPWQTALHVTFNKPSEIATRSSDIRYVSADAVESMKIALGHEEKGLSYLSVFNSIPVPGLSLMVGEGGMLPPLLPIAPMGSPSAPVAAPPVRSQSMPVTGTGPGPEADSEDDTLLNTPVVFVSGRGQPARGSVDRGLGRGRGRGGQARGRQPHSRGSEALRGGNTPKRYKK